MLRGWMRVIKELDPDPEPHILTLLDQFGIEPTKDNLDHLGVLLCALKTYSDREVHYGGTWRDFGSLGQGLNLARKAKRAWKALSLGSSDAACDDALDAINYAVFTIRCIAEGNIDGRDGA